MGNHVAMRSQQSIGRGGPVLWPPRSPDLTCLDYFLWWYVKSMVYETPVNSAKDIVAPASGEVRDTPGIFANVRSSMRQRCEACVCASRPGDIISNTYFDDDRCLFDVLFS
ncbi:hypothetical protein AVEN_237043-1 [Araneus ventricosus]|uniref:Uncharacterized protein n=1 Tax=Araneus ventricosus TaxID=182803 RepID=A0A4Y2SAG3_ARAVE|nr:hypothetical protein AVEN_237043-1 [Araneus ventricosus]